MAHFLAENAEARVHYDLAVEFTPTLVLRDRESDDIKRLWSGSVAAPIIASGILPPVCVQGGRYRCDKSLIWRLLLTATAAGLAREQQARAQVGGRRYGQESIAEKLSQRGVYPTPQRIRVARALFDGVAKHYTGFQVFAKLKATDERCCRATVYNCLKLFTEKKLLQESWLNGISWSMTRSPPRRPTSTPWRVESCAI